MAGKLLEKKKLKRKKILESGLTLFIEHHIHDVSVKDIADHAGVGNGTFYLYFKDKFDLRDTLVRNVVNEMFEKAESDLLKENIQNFEDVVIYVIDHVLDQLKDNLQILKFIERNLSYGISISKIHDSLPEDMKSREENFVRHSKEMNYELEKPYTILFLIIELVGCSCYSSILFNDPLPIDELKPVLYSSIRAILQTGRKK